MTEDEDEDEEDFEKDKRPTTPTDPPKSARRPVTFISDIRTYARSWRALSQFGSEVGNPVKVVRWALGRSLWVNVWEEVTVY